MCWKQNHPFPANQSCWHCVLLEELLVGQEEFIGDRSVLALLQDKRDIPSWAACGTLPSSPFGTLQPYLDFYNSVWGLLWLGGASQAWSTKCSTLSVYSLSPFTLENPKTDVVEVLALPSHASAVSDSTWPQGAHKHSWVLPIPRKTLICTLPPRWESNRNSLRHWSFMKQTKIMTDKNNAISNSFDSI